MEFKDLTFLKKIEHIWEYYKIHIIGTIFIAVCFWMFINHTFINPDPELYCGIAIYGPHLSTEETQKIDAYLTEKNVEPDVNEAVTTLNFFFTEGTEGEDVLQDEDMLNKFYTYLYALEIDLFIGTKEDFENCVKADFIDPLTDHLPAPTVKTFKDKGLLYYSKAPEDEEEKAYGIEVKNSALFREINILQDDTYYIGFVPLEGRKEKSAKTALEILKE